MRFQIAHDAKEVGGFGGGERCRWFVEDQDACIERQGLGDFDKLLLCHAQLADRYTEVNVDPEAFEQGFGFGAHGAFLQHAKGVGMFAAKINIFDSVEVGDQAEFLEDDRYTGSDCFVV